jgi:hypothetical protein
MVVGESYAAAAMPWWRRVALVLRKVVRAMSDGLKLPDSKGFVIPLALLMAVGYGLIQWGRNDKQNEIIISQQQQILAELGEQAKVNREQSGRLDQIASGSQLALETAVEVRASFDSFQTEIRTNLEARRREDRLFRDRAWGRIRHLPYSPPPEDPIDEVKGTGGGE